MNLANFVVSGVIRMRNQMTGSILGISGDIGRMVKSSERHIKKLNEQINSVHSGLKSTAKAAAGIAIAVAGSIATLSVPSMIVDNELQKVATVITSTMGGIQQSLDATKDASIAWSKSHVNSIQEYLEASYNMNSAGLNDIQAIAGTEAALTLATATMGNAADAANLLATIYNNLGDKTKNAKSEMGRLGDVLAATQAKFQIKDLAQLNDGLKYGASQAIGFGVTVEQLSTVIGALNTAGLQGGQAGTAFSATIAKMIPASKKLGFAIAETADGGMDFVGTLKLIEEKFGGFQEMTNKQKLAFQQAFGQEGVRSLQLLLGKTGELQTNLDAISASQGVSAKAQSQIESSRLNKLKILKNQGTAALVALGDAASEALSPVAKDLGVIVSSMSQWVADNAKFVGSGITETLKFFKDHSWGIHKALTAVGTALALFYTYATGVKMVTAAMKLFKLATIEVNGALMLNPMVAITAAVIAAIILIVTFWPEISNAAKLAWDAVSEFTNDAWETIKSYASGALDFIVGLIATVAPGMVQPMFAAVDSLKEYWGSFKEFLSGVWTWMGEAASVSAGIIRKEFQDVADFLGGVFSWIGEQWNTYVGGIVDAIGSFIDETSGLGRAARTATASTQSANQQTQARVVPPGERQATMMSESVSESFSSETHKNELLIRDETGRAQFATTPKKSSGLKMASTGAY